MNAALYYLFDKEDDLYSRDETIREYLILAAILPICHTECCPPPLTRALAVQPLLALGQVIPVVSKGHGA
jgi:hypothetical protein